MLQTTGVALWEWDLRTRRVWRSPEWDRQLGYEPGQLSDCIEDWVSRVHPDDRDPVCEAVQANLRDPQATCSLDYRMRHRDGTYRWLRADATLVRDERGKPVRLVGSQLDVTQRKEREQALAADERRQARMLADAAPHLMWELTVGAEVVYLNARSLEYFGYEPLTRGDWPEIVHPDDLPVLTRYWDKLLAPDASDEGIELRLRRKADGVFRWFWTRSTVVKDADGRVLTIVGSATDIHDLKAAEQALHEAQERLRAALEAAGMGTWVWTLHDQRNVWDSSMLKLLGIDDHSRSYTFDEVMVTVHPDDRAAVAQAMARAMEPGETFYAEFRSLKVDGSVLWLASKGRLERDDQGQPVRMVGACVDITRPKQLEEQLRQAQKMDAIGQLAGGVAHDFNNILMVILGEATLLSQRRTLDHSLQKPLQDIILAAERAASLTTQLLTFGRRQHLNMRETDLNQVVSDFSGMLRRVLGESVQLSVSASPRPVMVFADASMLSQVLLNLAINARDAMPKGGRLSITVDAALVTPAEAQAMPGARAGTWAYLLVLDEGDGIAPDVMPHIFEPFFTTKDLGRGTGLGLATVHGIIEQHSGFIHVESAPGTGSAFAVYLPLIDAPAKRREPEATIPLRAGAGELILLVEDEHAVRAMLETILRDSGYKLLVAQNGRDALALFSTWRDQVALVLTDQVMPDGLFGFDLIAQMRAQRPDLRAIVSSGYSAEGLAQRCAEVQGIRFLPKPYKPGELLRQVREALDG